MKKVKLNKLEKNSTDWNGIYFVGGIVMFKEFNIEIDELDMDSWELVLFVDEYVVGRFDGKYFDLSDFDPF